MKEKFEDAITVGEFVSAVKRTIDEIFESAAIVGEITKITITTSGHAYFTLKDDDASISCVMFKSSLEKIDFDIEAGSRYIVYARPSIYEKTGSFQLNVTDMIIEGEGLLAIKFERLKKKLAVKGYFDISSKKPIPQFPKAVGVVSSSQAAALGDILSVSKNRAPNIDIIIYPTLVQGLNAPKSIAAAIVLANKRKEVDVLIVGRGGGSSEDLSAFNDELVATAIYKSAIPIISAVGHEIDISIADMVADARAQTPTAAVELAFPDMVSIASYLAQAENKLTMLLQSLVSNMHDKIDKYSIKYMLSIIEAKYDAMGYEYDNINKRLNDSLEYIYKDKKSRYIALVEKLNLLSPLDILSRGYSHTTKDGKSLLNADNIKSGDIIQTQLRDCKIKSKVL